MTDDLVGLMGPWRAAVTNEPAESWGTRFMNQKIETDLQVTLKEVPYAIS